MKLTEDFSIQKNKASTTEHFYYDENGRLTDQKKESCAEIVKIGLNKIHKAFYYIITAYKIRISFKNCFTQFIT